MNDETYMIRSSRLPELREKLEKLNRRATKLGMLPVRFEVGEAVFNSVNGIKGVQVVSIRIEGSAPVVAGWTFAGVIEFAGQGNLIKAYAGASVPERFRRTSNTCDHFGKERKRNSVILLRKGGDWKQIGNACVSDYVRSDDAVEALSVLSMLDEIRDCLNQKEDEEETECRGDGYSTVGFLAAVVATIEKEGWVPRSKAEERGVPATAERAAKRIEDGFSPTTENLEEATKALEWGKKIVVSSDYTNNVQVVCASSHCAFRNTGILASVIASYRASKDAAKEAAASGYLGKVGDKVAWDLTLRSRYVCNGVYGATTILSFLDSEGNVVVWKASGIKLSEDERGTIFAVKGTIKAHTDYKGTKQTLLTRCALTPQRFKTALAKRAQTSA